MLALYPKLFRRYVLLSVLLAAGAAAVALFVPGVSVGFWILMGALGLFALLVSMSQQAMREHEKELSRLYNDMDAEGFARDYRIHLEQKLWSTDTEVMIRMHLSNAYIALGEFDHARKMLNYVQPAGRKKKETLLFNRFAMESNLCFVEEEEGNAEEARRRYDALMQLRQQLEEIQSAKPENRRAEFSTELTELCLRLLETGKTDAEALKRQVRASSRRLQKVTVSLWAARACLADGQREEAEKLLRRIVELAPRLHPGREAKKLLESLPQKRA